METKKFLAELMKRIPEQENVKMELASDRINVNFGENNGFYARASGGISCYGDTVYNDIFYALYNKITEVSRMVKEYMDAMANAPPLTAIDFDMPYKKLAEFNGVVLGGIETENGEYNFTTWRKDNNSLYWGHYYGTDYTAAKEDFVIRSNLVNENKFFDSEELAEISRCIKNTLEDECTLTDTSKVLLDKIYKKIEEAVPGLDELTTKLQEQGYNQSL